MAKTAASARALSPLAVLAAALAVAAVHAVPDLLMPRLRRFYQTRMPEVAARWQLDGRYTAVGPFDDTDMNENAGRAREAADKLLPYDPYVVENHSRRLLFSDTLSFITVGWLARLTGGIDRGWVAAKCFGAFFWALGCYLLVFAVSGNRRWAVLAAVVLPLTDDLAKGIIAYRGLLAFKDAALHFFYLTGHYAYFQGVGRLSNPALITPPLLLAAYFAARTAQKPSPGNAAATALLGGSLAYFHGDAWTTYVAGMGLYCLGRSLRDRRAHAWLWGALVGSLLIGLPWFLYNFPQDPNWLARAGAHPGRELDSLGLLWVAAGAGLWAAFPADAALTALGSFMAGAGAVAESSLLTGTVVHPSHWNFLGAVLLSAAVLGLIGRRLRDERDWLWLAALVCFWGVARGVTYASNRFPYQALSKDLEQAFDWLKGQTPVDSVVAGLAPVETLILPTHTRSKTLVGMAFVLATDMSTDETIRRQKRALEELGIPVEDFAKRLSSVPPTHELNLAWNRALWDGRLAWEEREWSLINNYDHSLSREDFLARLRRLDADRAARVDYLWVGPFERALMSPKALKALGAPAYRNATVAIYKR